MNAYASTRFSKRKDMANRIIVYSNAEITTFMDGKTIEEFQYITATLSFISKTPCKLTHRNKIINNTIYEKICEKDGFIQLKSTLNGLTYYITKDKLFAHFLPSQCSTGHSVQGLTINEKYTVNIDLTNKHIGPDWIITAFSRTTDPRNVSYSRFRANKEIHKKDFIARRIEGHKIYDQNNDLYNEEQFIDVDNIKALIHKQYNSCYYCRKPLTYSIRGVKTTNMSIDRIDSSVGHIKKNVRISCLHCNVIKKNRD